MKPTIEEVKNVAWAVKQDNAFGAPKDYVSLTLEELQAFAQHYIEVGRKEQRDKDVKLCKELYDLPTTSESDYTLGFNIGCRECIDAIRNSTGE